MKYRRLTNDELEALEQDFIRFLSVHAITGPDWVQIKQNEPEKAMKFIEDFSDMVFEKVLQNISYIEYRNPKLLRIHHCLKDKMEIVGVEIDKDADIDLTKTDSMANALSGNGLEDAVFVFREQQEYKQAREQELYELLQKGFLITDERLFNVLSAIKNKG